MAGILAFGTYVPYARLRREAISQALGVAAGRGTRAVASYDEDTTSMGVEAGRSALAGLNGASGIDTVLFATTSPAYSDKSNATAVHAALGLDASVLAFDCVGAVRSGVGALCTALDLPAPSLLVLSDIRTGLPRSGDERDGGDGAAALVVGPGTPDSPVLAEYLGGAAATGEFLDRWRIPGDTESRVWEDRFSEHAYLPLAEQAISDAAKQAGVAPSDVDRLIVTGTNARAVRVVAGRFGARPEALHDDLTTQVGNTGTAHPALLLASALEQARPGEVIAVVALADGADVLFFETTHALAEYRCTRPVTAQLSSGDDGLAYTTFLTWRGFLHQEPARRPDPERPAAPASLRTEAWKFAFVGSRCTCHTRHLPPQRVCVTCGATDQMTPEPLADVPASVATYTVDHLAHSLNPPVVVAVIDFEGGGRFQCEMTDVDPDAVTIGLPVEMTFRRLYTAGGVHNYFWKARPVRGGTY